MNLSAKQNKALELMKSITEEFDTNEDTHLKWFVQSELPYITLHSLDALVSKGLIEEMECKTTGHMYYRIK